MALKPPEDPKKLSKLETQELDWEIVYDIRIKSNPSCRKHAISGAPPRNEANYRNWLISRYLLAGWTSCWFSDDDNDGQPRFNLLRLDDRIHNKLMAMVEEILAKLDTSSEERMLCVPLDPGVTLDRKGAVIQHLKARLDAKEVRYVKDKTYNYLAIMR